jgi:ComF family protein
VTTVSQVDESSSGKLIWLRRGIDACIDLLFPPHCVSCKSLGSWLCATCTSSIEVIEPPLCRHCGLPLQHPGPEGVTRAQCSHCRGLPQEWEGLLAYAYHDGALREAIHQFKYEDMRCLAPILAELMAHGWGVLVPDGRQPTAIVPIPLHPSRQRQRGYNQAALLARELGTHLHCPVVEGALLRVRATTPQVGLGVEERRANVHGAFRCTDDRLRGWNILLVDDVCTTGSTLESACLALKTAGVASVLAYTLARARPSGPDT